MSEYHRGYPLQNLRPLLQSDNERLVNTGIWIASELGAKGKPLLNDVSPLLRHPGKKARFFAIDCILVWAGPSDKNELASVVALLEDVEAAVRWKAMGFLWRASQEQLEAALSHLEVTGSESPHLRGLQWLLGSGGSDPREVIAVLHSEAPIMRKYGAVAAARMAKSSREALLRASSVEDSDVKHFADSTIRLL